MSADNRLKQLKGERRLFLGATVAVVLIALTGFARTYYLKGLFGTPPLPRLVHFHGFIMTGWLVLFLTQVFLVAGHRTDIHRKLGVLGGFWALLVVIVGYLTAVAMARRGQPPLPSPLGFMIVPLGDMFVFSIFIGAGLYMRRKRDYHKRLMLMSCGALLAAAISRIPLGVLEQGGPLTYFGLTDLCILTWVAVDTYRNRRLHPVFGWGALFIILSQPARIFLSGSQVWLQFAQWLVS